jgi:small subunit ribosomal protein S14
MAKRSKITAESRRRRLVEKYAQRRALLRDRVRTADRGSDELGAAVRALSRLPRDSSAVRLRNRDQVDGRPRGYVRKAGVSRIRFREMAHRGELPGITKSSW